MPTNPSKDALQRMKLRTGMPDASALNNGLFLRAGADGQLGFAPAGTGPQGPQGPQGPTGAGGDSAEAIMGKLEYQLSSPFFSTTNSSNNGYADPLIMFDDMVTDRLYGRGTEIVVTRTTASGGTYTLSDQERRAVTDGNYDSTYQPARTTNSDYGEDVTLNIDFLTNKLSNPTHGFVYPQGYMFITCYAGRGIKAISGRLKKSNGTWYPLSAQYDILKVYEYGGNTSGWRIRTNLTGNFLVEVELTLTPYTVAAGDSADTEIWVNAITYHGTRSGADQGPIVTCGGGKYFGDMTGVVAGTTNWTITPSGSADFEDDIKHQGRNVLPQNQFFDAANGYVYTVYGVNSNWKATRAGSAGMAQTAVQTSNLPTTLSAVQALTYS